VTISRLSRIARQRLRSLSRKQQLDAELSAELAIHFDQLVRENTAAGLAPQEARLAARRALGSAGSLAEECRDQRRVTWLHDLWQDLRFGLRVFRKNPAFTAIATISLALGIGANTAVLGAMDALLLGSLPFPDAGRLVRIRTFRYDSPQQLHDASIPAYLAWKSRSRAFESIGTSLASHQDLSDVDQAAAERISGQAFDSGMFPTLGSQPLLGRVFSQADYWAGPRVPVMVLSYRLWQRRFAADPGIVGRSVRLNGVPTTIIGVMPPGFLRIAEDRVDFWVPLFLNPNHDSQRYYITIARLHGGTSLRQAQADVDAIARQLSSDAPQRHAGWGVRVQTLREAVFGWTRTPLLTLEAAFALVLLIACANLAGLLLARGLARRPEIAMRVALGAGRGRIVRQLLTESLLLSLAGGALGLLLAWWGLAGLLTVTPPPGAPRLDGIGLHFRTLPLAAAISLITGLGFGLVPALAAFRAGLTGFLKSDPIPGTLPGGHRLRSILVAGQIALALVLLAGSGLFLKSYLRLSGRPLNFEPHGLLTFELRIPFSQYSRQIGWHRDFPRFEISPHAAGTIERVYHSLRELPGADSVAGISLPPVNSLVLITPGVLLDARPVPGSAVYFLVTPGFFATMRAPLLRGREFDRRDTRASPWTAVVNQSAARWLWPGQDPIGKRFTLDTVPEEQPRQVIGVVRDIPTRNRRTVPDPVIYASYLQQPPTYANPGANMFGQMTFLLRASGDPVSLLPAIRQAVAEVDPRRALASVLPMEELVAGRMPELFNALVIGAFAFVATLLAAIGIYGVMAYSLQQRTHEIGIRMALGATARQVAAFVGRRGVLLVLSGLAAGLAGALLLTRLIRSQLWGVTPVDPTTFAAVSLLLALVAALACYVPVRRAMSVDPAAALRSE
jgi:putative ABC transport system permease protein